MCTATWIRDTDGYAVWFTRDERRDRAEGRRPARYDHPDLPFLAPRDPQGSGTWIGVNAAGLTVGLGNGAPGPDEPSRPVSRGRIVWNLLSAHGIEAARGLLESEPLERTRPFVLVLLAPSEPARLVHWDGRALRDDWAFDSGVLLATSSLGTEVEQSRRARIEAEIGGRWTPKGVEAIHRSPLGDVRTAVCVDRPDVVSVSMSRIRVGAGLAEFEYTPGPPSRTAPDIPLSLELRTVGAPGA